MRQSITDLWFDAFRKKDIAVLEQNLADNFMHASPYGEIKGKDAYLDLVRGNTEAFFDCTIEILDTIESESSAAVRYLVNSRPACDVIHVENSKVTRIFSYYHVGNKPTY